MDKKIKVKEQIINNSEISQGNGLNISYNKEDLKKHFPNLTSEIVQSKKQLSIDAIRTKEEHKEDPFETYKEDLSNPGVFDFIRRCESLKEALEIIEYLFKRKEIPEELYNLIKESLSEEDGLNKLISKIGGYKEPGYYQNKYYKNI
ncbi:MAG: DUF2095 domain-containing protein [Promethearchaeota archaeon]|nr:MAG: DUF2095 domain-containing protein [Candidatus Lokiarchaeota archaeon]